MKYGADQENYLVIVLKNERGLVLVVVSLV